MAECGYCKQEMKDMVSCVEEEIVIQNQKYPQIPYERDGVPNCGSCKTPTGGFHHPGCGVERCPRCGGQMNSCGCLDDEDDDEEADG